MNKKFVKSFELLKKENEENGFDLVEINWEIEQDGFLLQHWVSKSRGSSIIQIYADGKGYSEYTTLNELDKEVKTLLQAARKLTESGLTLEVLSENDAVALGVIIEKFKGVG